jgi:hypothetical protein
MSVQIGIQAKFKDLPVNMTDVSEQSTRILEITIVDLATDNIYNITTDPTMTATYEITDDATHQIVTPITPLEITSNDTQEILITSEENTKLTSGLRKESRTITLVFDYADNTEQEEVEFGYTIFMLRKNAPLPPEDGLLDPNDSIDPFIY